MTERRFDFFANTERSIPLAAVPEGMPSGCRTDLAGPNETDSTSIADEPISEGNNQGGEWHIELESGELLPVGQGLVLGREPTVRRHHDSPAMAVALDDESGRLSRNHLAILSNPSRLVAVDLGSSNGTHLGRRSQIELIPPNKAVELIHGDQLHIGTRLITVWGNPKT